MISRRGSIFWHAPIIIHKSRICTVISQSDASRGRETDGSDAARTDSEHAFDCSQDHDADFQLFPSNPHCQGTHVLELFKEKLRE
jgi:hypothetical protein